MQTYITELYCILGVANNAPFEEVKKAYRRKALLLHPDKNPNDAQNATARFQRLQAAFEAVQKLEESKR